MNGRTLTPLLEGGAFFESPRWHEGRWWVSDFYREAIYTVTTDGNEECVGGDDGRTLLVCAAPDFLEANRRQAREGVLLTAAVAVPHAGMP